MTFDLSQASAADFEPRRGEMFGAAGPTGNVDLRLHQVQSHGEGARTGGAFTLTFVGPAGPHLPQAIYPLTHGHFGTLELFLVPIGPTDGGNGYEAVFA